MTSMPRRLIALLLVAISSAGAAEPLNHPAANAVDYEARYVDEPKNDQTLIQGHTILHHGGLFRRQSRQRDRTSFEYSRLGSTASLSITTGDDGLPRSMRFASPFDTERRETRIEGRDKLAQFGKESCRWWSLRQHRVDVADDGWPYGECYTGDGLLIATRRGPYGKDATYFMELAKEIYRRPVTMSEILPAPVLLDPTIWIDYGRGSDQATRSLPDYVVTYQDDKTTVERKRHFPWLREKRTDPAGLRHVRAWSEIAPVGWSMRMGTENRPGVFYIADRKLGDWETRAFGSEFDLVTTPIKTSDRETILGETCIWYDMAPGIYDAGQRQCLTSDMVPLAIEHYGDVSGVTRMTALKVSREPVSFDEMKPPKEWFDLSYWGLTK